MVIVAPFDEREKKRITSGEGEVVLLRRLEEARDLNSVIDVSTAAMHCGPIATEVRGLGVTSPAREGQMADFRIWGRVEHIGPSEFFVVASALPDNAQNERPIVLTLTAHSLAQANAERNRLMVDAGAQVRARGDRVIDVEA